MSGDKILFGLESPHGAGSIYFAWQTSESGNHLATTGSDGTVAIFNRQGQLQDRIVLQAFCSGFAWDCEGDLLGIITSSSSQVILWDINQRQKHIIDTGLRDALTCIIWSKTSPVLAVTTARGNLAIYNHQTTKRIPILGKHSKRIVCGAWSRDNILALGGEDKTLSLSSEDGDSLRVVQLRDIPSDMCFAEIKTDERVPGENTISMILGKKTLYLYHLPEPDSPAELGFQHKYGQLLQHRWFGDGYVLLGFSQGNVVAISTHPKEVGQELWQIKNHRDSLSSIAICRNLELVASCGDNKVKIHATANLQETLSILTIPDQSGVKDVDWSSDGQLIAASSAQGSIYIFVTKLYSLNAVSFPRIVLLSSLAEVTIYNYAGDKIRTPLNVLQLEIEPSIISVGPHHFACGMNNRAWFYDLGRSFADTPIPLGDREYMAEVNDIKLNSLYCAALCGGKVLLHATEPHNPATKDQQPQLFPENIHGIQDTKITDIELTSDFFIFSTDLGNLVFFSLEYWTMVTNYRHSSGIKNIFAGADGARLIFIDDHNQGYVYSASNEETILIPNISKTCKGFLWDCAPGSNSFISFDDKHCIEYNFVKYAVNGKQVIHIGETTLLSDQKPIMLCDGDISLATSDGNLSSMPLKSHINSPTVELKDQLQLMIKLRKFNDAWEVCKSIGNDESWNNLGIAAISDLNIPFAIKVFRQLGKASMVFALKSVSYLEDVNFLSGFCALLLNKTDEAKIFFTKSANPLEALELCRDLLQWEQAIALAETLAPEQIPVIAREYAQQLEFTGKFSEALMNYERGLDENQLIKSGMVDNNLTEHFRLCKFGIARTHIKLGDYKKGIKLAMELNDKQLLHDSAEALVTIGQSTEAAQLYEMAESWDEACHLFVQLKAWQKVNTILPHVSSAKMHATYAKACEDDGKFDEAIKSYRNAGDMDSVVRIYIEHMSDPHSASEIVMETRSIEGAKLLARFYQNIGDFEQALQFLILCGCVSDAFTIAQRHNKLRQYAELLEHSENAQPSNFLSVAQHFETEKYTLLAGKYYFLGKEYSKALKHLIKAAKFSNDENIALSLAIDCVASSNDEKLAAQLIEFLLGENDGTPKDPKFLFGLYMARKQFREAAKTAVIISNQEQIIGNYRNAHDLLFSMYQELRQNNLTVGADMKNNLALLHRYTLVRTHVKIGDHHQAAKLLIKVAANISQFPAHIVPILTSTVIECHRVGFQKAAFSYASMLMRSEYRSQIDSKYTKKIEAIVRKAPRGIKDTEDDFQNETQKCPLCDYELPIMELTCNHCKATLPMCIASGQHISKENLAACPACDFLCFEPQMAKILNATNQCPMCGEIVDSNRLNNVENITEYLSV